MIAKPRTGANRRRFLQVGSIAGLSLSQVLRLQAAVGSQAAKKDVNCIFLFILGGMPHQDMWDLKPEAPSEIRGEFNPIRTAVPGMQISDVLPGIAKVTDKLAILRSMTHGESVHEGGFHVMMTGVKAPVGALVGRKDNNQHPSLGSMIAKCGRSNGELPPYISVPNFIDSGGPAFLGAGYAPLVIDADPAAPDFAVRDITLPEEIGDLRSRRRQSALREINRFEQRVENVGRNVRALDKFYEKSYRLMTSAKAKEAFDIAREREVLREQYGMTSVGQCCLLARRLVEAGCRFVSIENGHWDTHRKNAESLRDLLVPAFDKAVPALLNDLQARGLLDETLVVISTEFGRTPQINKLAGRDHWPGAFSVCMAGAGLKVGQTIGSTDKHAASVVDRPITPADLTATILTVLGIDPAATVHTAVGRPVQLAGGATPVTELLPVRTNP